MNVRASAESSPKAAILKGTGFSPYVQAIGLKTWALAPEAILPQNAASLAFSAARKGVFRLNFGVTRLLEPEPSTAPPAARRPSKTAPLFCAKFAGNFASPAHNPSRFVSTRGISAQLQENCTRSPINEQFEPSRQARNSFAV